MDNQAVQNSYSPLEVRRLLIGTVSLMGLAAAVQGIVMFAALFDSAKTAALGGDVPRPDYFDFFLGKVGPWSLLPPALALLFRLVTLLDAVRHQPTSQSRFVWCAVLIVGQIVACLVYRPIELRKLIAGRSPTAP